MSAERGVSSYSHGYLPGELEHPPAQDISHPKVAQKMFESLVGGNRDNGGAFTLATSAGLEDRNRWDRAKKQGFEVAMESVVQESVGTYESSDPEMIRVRELAPELCQAVTRSPYIDAVCSPNAGDLVRWSLEGAKNPILINKTSIRVGFGGSEDEHATMRLPAYLLPAIDVHRRLSVVAEKREAAARSKGVKFVYSQEYGNQDIPRDERKAILDGINEQFEFNHLPSDVQKMLREQVGTFSAPEIVLFFAPNAAIEINGMNQAKVNANVQRNQMIAQAFMERFYPDAKVKFITDRPWEAHGNYTQTVIRYLSELADNSPDPAVRDAIKDLRDRGTSRGNEQGSISAHIYAALHPYAFFNDRVDAPQLSTLVSNQDPSAAVITIGGKPERLFNAVREDLSRSANADDLLAFAEREGRLNTRELKRLYDWQTALQNRRDSYTSDNIFDRAARVDRPMLNVPLITNRGTLPVYYQTPWDRPLNRQNVQLLIESEGDFSATYQNGGSIEADAHVSRAKQKSVDSDMQALIDAVGAEKLKEFYKDLVKVGLVT